MDTSIDAYNNAADEYARSRIGKEDSYELENLRSYVMAGSKVLDVGCAAGRDTRILKNMGFDVVGTDLAEKLLDIARSQNPDIKFVLADMRKLPFQDATFDAIWASAVLHHLRKAEMPAALSEFRRILTPGGTLYVHTKAGKGSLTSSEVSVEGEERNFELVSADELDAVLTDCGYTKLSLNVKGSKSRQGLHWVSAFYRKSVAA